jgi:hypothetical protein
LLNSSNAGGEISSSLIVSTVKIPDNNAAGVSATTFFVQLQPHIKRQRTMPVKTIFFITDLFMIASF